MTRELTAFRLQPNLMEGLRIMKERDGISISEQVNKAVEGWLVTHRATPTDIYRMFDDFEHGLTASSNKSALQTFKLPTAFGSAIGGQLFGQLTRTQMETIDRLAEAARRPTRSYWDFWIEAKFKDGRGVRQAFDAGAIQTFYHVSDGYRPELERNVFSRAQKESVFRLFVYGNMPFIVPSVDTTLQALAGKNDSGKKVLLFTRSMFLDVEARHLDSVLIEERVEELAEFYPGKQTERARRTVAECEQADLDVLVTIDQLLVKHLAPHTKLLLGEPFDCWRRMRVPNGASPRWEPANGHPLFGTDWWRW